jgi:hypothetical protein
MRNLLLLLFCLFSITCFGQQSDTTSGKKSSPAKVVFDDSALIRLTRFQDSIRKAEEMEEFNKTNQKNLSYFLQLQKERRAKQKRNAIIRIAIGIGFLIILVIGLRRRAKKAGNRTSI